MKTDLSKTELNLILDIIHLSLDCHTISEFDALLAKVKKLTPFSHARCGFGDSKEFKTESMAAFKTLTAFPSEWENRYAKNNYVLEDAVALIAYQKKGLLYWEDCLKIHNQQINGKARAIQILDEAASIGLKDGWIYSLQGRRATECSIISLGGDNLKKDVRTETILEHLGPHLGQAVKKMVIGKTKAVATLTPRECEILSWTSAGKTAWETSQILTVSQRTVEYHMGNILNKLDATNAQQAIAIAVFHGLIAY